MIKINLILIVLLNAVLLTTGQMLWKIGLKNIELAKPLDYIAAIFSPKIFAGLLIYAFATLVWFYVLKKYDFTKVYPLMSVSYIIGLAAGYFILHEAVTKNSIIGTALICVGVFVLVSK